MNDSAREVDAETFVHLYREYRHPLAYSKYLGVKGSYHYMALYDAGFGDWAKYNHCVRVHEQQLPGSFPDRPQKPILWPHKDPYPLGEDQPSRAEMILQARETTPEMFVEVRNDAFRKESVHHFPLGEKDGWTYLAILDADRRFVYSIRARAKEVDEWSREHPPAGWDEPGRW